MGQPRRFFFVHLQKTAGTALILRLRRQFDRSAIYPDESDGDKATRTIDVDVLRERWRARGDEIQVVTGHFPLCTMELLEADFATLTLLRDPVERTLSYLRHQQRLSPELRREPMLAVYEDRFRFEGFIHNHMVKMFALTTEEMTAGALTVVSFERAHLERAMERLASVDVIGLQERFEQFCRELSARFGWRLGPPLWANRTEASIAPDERLVARIVEDNALDIELYAFAQRLVAERSAGQPASDNPVAARSGLRAHRS
jgi:hypothetical protein